jgi:hypothetical protein
MVSLVAQLNATGDAPHLAMDINSQVHLFTSFTRNPAALYLMPLLILRHVNI